MPYAFADYSRGPTTESENQRFWFRTDVDSDRIEERFVHIESSWTLKPMRQLLRLANPSEMKGPEIASNQVPCPEIPLVLDADQ